MSRQILSIYGYTDYRKYLSDFYHFRKDSERGYSYRTFAKAAGFASPNLLKLVIEGQRNLTPTSTEKFITGLGIPSQMSQYFRALVRFNQSTSDDEKANLHSELVKLTPTASRRQLGGDELNYLSNWLCPILREMIQLPEFNEDLYWISRRIQGNPSTAEIAKALNFLIAEGFIKRNDKGKLEPAEAMICTTDETKSLGIRNYHRHSLQRAAELISSLPVEEREYGALTFILPEEKVQELKFKMKNFRQELHRWAAESLSSARGETVIQLNLQMYPQTRKIKE